MPYIIRVNKRARRIILRMRSDKIVRVTTPPGIRRQYVETVLQESAQSILAQYQKLDNAGEVFCYLGKPLPVRVYPSRTAYSSVKLEGGELQFSTVTTGVEEKRQLYKKILHKIGKTYLTKRCVELAAEHGFTVASVKVRHMQSRWGSCTSRKTITLNAALMQCPPEVIDYVVIHELCHTRVPDHTPRFWMEVEKYLPDFRRLRYALRQYSVI